MGNTFRHFYINHTKKQYLKFTSSWTDIDRAEYYLNKHVYNKRVWDKKTYKNSYVWTFDDKVDIYIIVNDTIVTRTQENNMSTKNDVKNLILNYEQVF